MSDYKYWGLFFLFFENFYLPDSISQVNRVVTMSSQQLVNDRSVSVASITSHVLSSPSLISSRKHLSGSSSSERQMSPWERELKERVFSLLIQCKRRIMDRLSFILDQFEAIRIQNKESMIFGIFVETFTDASIEKISPEEYYIKIKQRLVGIRTYMIDFWASNAFDLSRGTDRMNVWRDAETITQELLSIAFVHNADVTIPKGYLDLDQEVRGILLASSVIATDENRSQLYHICPILFEIDKAALYVQALINLGDPSVFLKMKRVRRPSQKLRIKRPPTADSIIKKTSNQPDTNGWHTIKSKQRSPIVSSM